MKKHLIALDGGTTNTRLTLVGEDILARKKLSVGIRDGRDALSAAVKTALAEFLRENALTEGDVEAIAVSGMATSELGLYCVPHITAPAGINELSDGAVRVNLPEITEIPFIFIPGVKTFSGGEAPLEDMDIMRGEEVEAVAIADRMGLRNATLILPGSHMKIVHIEDGRIVGFKTSVSGELTRAASENTILKNSLGEFFTHVVDKKWLHTGYELSEKLGMGSALFKIRVAGNFLDATKEELYSCLIGAVLHDDVKAIAEGARGTAIVGGSNPFRAAYAELLSGKVKCVCEISEDLAENAAAYGAAIIAKI